MNNKLNIIGLVAMLLTVVCTSCGGSSAKADGTVAVDSTAPPPKHADEPEKNDPPKTDSPKTDPPKNVPQKPTVNPSRKPDLTDTAKEAARKPNPDNKPVVDPTRVVNTPRKDELNDTTLERYIPDSNRIKIRLW